MSRVARVLGVDEPPVLELVKEFLVTQGIWWRGTHSGAQAFAMMELSPPDVLLLDIKLPVMDGVTICGGAHAVSQIRVIMLTANADEAVAKDTRGAAPSITSSAVTSLPGTRGGRRRRRAAWRLISASFYTPSWRLDMGLSSRVLRPS